MILTEAEIAEALGVTPEEVTNGAMWLLPALGGARVRASIIRDADGGDIFVQVSEEVPGEGDSQVAWLSGSTTGAEGAFTVSGYDNTGEFSDSHDPRAVAAVIRRQIAAIRDSEDGRKIV